VVALGVQTIRGGGSLLSIVLLALAVWLHLSFVLPQLAKPFVYDEVAFALVGEGVAATGRPYADLGHIGQSGLWGIEGDPNERFGWGLWHPPLYAYVLGLSFSTFGVSEWSARLVGVVCNLGAAAFVFLATRRLLRDRSAKGLPLGWAGIAALLYLTSPLVVQSALLLDIDGTVLVLLLSILTYLSLRLIQADSQRAWLWWLGLTVAVFALSLWAKMTSPWAFPVALLGFRMLGRSPWRPWRGIVEVAALAGGGTVLFLATWWLACSITGMSFEMPFQVLWSEFHDAAGSSSAWRSNPHILAELVAYVTLWISPYLLGLFLFAAVWRVGALFVSRPAFVLQPVDVVLAAGGGLALLYLLKLAASFPKYHIAMMPMWAVAAAWLLARAVGRVGPLETSVYALCLLGFGSYFASQVQDRWVLFSGWSFVAPLVLVPAALGLGFLAIGPLLRRDSIIRQASLLLLLLVLAWSNGVNAQQRLSGGSTNYYYGVSGMVEAGQVVDQTVQDGEPYIAAKEVAWYSRHRQFLDQDVFIGVLDQFELGGDLWDGKMMGIPVRVLALFIWDPTSGQRYRDHFQSRYDLVGHEGTYFIFVRRDDPAL
jgi:4-amino-4-deoxy-L-arabinose transferase-like glycosyltransferase